MSYTAIRYVGDGITNTRVIPWSYRYKEDVVVTVNGTVTAISEWVNDSTIRINATPGFLSGKTIEVTRKTNIEAPAATFVGGGLDYNDLNSVTEQMLMSAQESYSLIQDAVTKYSAMLTNIAALQATVNGALAASTEATTEANTAMAELQAATTAVLAATASSTSAASSAASGLAEANTRYAAIQSAMATLQTATNNAISAAEAATASALLASVAAPVTKLRLNLLCKLPGYLP